MVRETHLSPTDFIYPLFVVGGEGVREEISALPGQFHLSVDETVKEADAYADVAESRGWFPGEKFAWTMRRSRLAGAR